MQKHKYKAPGDSGKSMKDSRDFMTAEYRSNQAKIKNQLNVMESKLEESSRFYRGRKMENKEINKRHPRGRGSPRNRLRLGRLSLGQGSLAWRSRSFTILPGQESALR